MTPLSPQLPLPSAPPQRVFASHASRARPSLTLRVLLADDHALVRAGFRALLKTMAGVEVVAEAANGREALDMMQTHRPDVVFMDIAMPVLNGLEALARASAAFPEVDVIILSVHADEEHVLHCLRAGARGYLLKIAIGASTGGPPVIQTILAGLPKDLPVPITIVQHITQGFTAGFASWLADTTGFVVRVPENGEHCAPGKVYIAPDGVHLEVDHEDRIVLNNDPPENGLKPSVAHLFGSTARVFREKAVGVLLKGMGRDGAEGLKMMRDAGAVTIAQDRESSVVFGMNGEAVSLGTAMYVLPPEKIAGALVGLVKANHRI